VYTIAPHVITVTVGAFGVMTRLADRVRRHVALIRHLALDAAVQVLVHENSTGFGSSIAA